MNPWFRVVRRSGNPGLGLERKSVWTWSVRTLTNVKDEVKLEAVKVNPVAERCVSFCEEVSRQSAVSEVQS